MIRIIEQEDVIYYRLGRQLHRCNGPAVIWKTEVDDWHTWWLYGNWHRYYGAQDTFGGWRIHGEKIK